MKQNLPANGRLEFLTQLALTRGAKSQMVSGHGGILWSSDGNGDARTWTEVMAIVDFTRTQFPIYLNDPSGVGLNIPPGTYNLHDCWFEQTRFQGLTASTVRLADGAVLQNLTKISGPMTLRGEPTSAPCLTVTDAILGNPKFAHAENDAVFANFGTRAMIDTEPGGVFVFVCQFQGGYTAGNPATSMISLGAGGILVTSVSQGSNNIDPRFVAGTGNTLIFDHDGSVSLNSLGPFPFFTGTIANAAYTTSGGSGPTSFRPQPFLFPIRIGTTYYDTDLAALIVWNGAAWVLV